MNYFILSLLLSSKLLFASEMLPQFTLSYYESVDAHLDISQVVSKPFQTLKNNTLSKGFNPHTFWLKLEVNSLIKAPYTLYLNNPTLDIVNFYNEKTLAKQTGDHRKGTNKKEIGYTFNMETNTYNTFYIEIQSKNGLFTQFTLHSQNDYFLYTDREKLFFTFFFGFLFSLIIYNTFLFITLKEKVYFYYIAFQISIFMLLLSYSGLGYYLLWKDNVFLNEFIYEKFEIFALFFALIFAQAFLKIRQHSNLLNHTINLTLLLLLYIAITPWVYSPVFFQIVLLQTVLLGLVMISYAIAKKIKNATLFFIATFFILLGTLITFLKIFGIFEVNFATTWSVYIGSMIEAILFSIALAQRIESLKLKQQQAKQDASQKDTLLKELRHRMKNNLQVISSFVNIAQMESQDEEKVFNALQDRITSITNLHEVFEIQKNKQDTIEMNQYFSLLIQNIQSIYDKDNSVSVTSNIETLHLPFDKSMLLGLILNEVLTNAFKYAFKDIKTPHLSIKFYKKETNTFLTVSDNGNGFDVTKLSQGLGLTLIKRMIEKQLQGSYILDSNQKGTVFRVLF